MSKFLVLFLFTSAAANAQGMFCSFDNSCAYDNSPGPNQVAEQYEQQRLEAERYRRLEEAASQIRINRVRLPDDRTLDCVSYGLGDTYGVTDCR